MTESAEQRLFAEIREITHTLRGNGTKGVVSRLDAVEETLRREAEERRDRAAQAAEDKKNSLWRRLLFHGATVGIALVLGAVWNNYLNRTPSPVEKTLSAEEQKAKAETKQQLDEMKGDLKAISERLTAPAPARPSRYVAPKPVTKHKKDGAMLQPGEMISPRDHEPPMLSYSRIPLLQMKVPE